MPDNAKVVLEMQSVYKTYNMGKDNFNALSDINVKIKKGEFISIIGPSGSGKSTMLNMVGVLDRPSKGKIFIDGIDISMLNDNELATIRGKKIGFVFQTFNLVPRLTALENVMLPMWFADVDADTRVVRARELLKKVGLENKMDNLPNQLSGGERQRVAIARALANNPEVLLGDEPTGNLDSKTGETIIKILKDLNAEGNTLIIVTHDQHIAKQADRQIKLLDGKII